MSVDTRLEGAVSDLETAFTPPPPSLPNHSDRPAISTITILVAVVLVAGVVAASTRLQGDRSSVDAVAAAETTPPTSVTPTSVTPTSVTPTSVTPPPAESASEVADQLLALASPPPPGFRFDRGTSVTDSATEFDIPCAGCVSLEIRRSTWLPIGPQDLITVGLHRSLYRNPAGAEELSIRGREATLATDGWQQTLVWDEESGLTVVVAANGYERAELLAVAEGLTIDSDSSTAQAMSVPEGSTTVAAEAFDRPKVLLQYRSDDDDPVTVQVYDTELVLTADRRADLRAAVESDGLSDGIQQLEYLERDGGIGVFFTGHDQSVVQFWTADGLVLHLQGDAGQVGQEALTDLAASFKTVSADAWEAAGGE